MLKYIVIILLVVFLYCNYCNIENFSPGTGIQLLTSKPYYTNYDYHTWMNKYPYDYSYNYPSYRPNFPWYSSWYRPRNIYGYRSYFYPRLF